MKGQFPPELQERIVNAELRAGDISLTGSDWLLPSRKPIQGNTVCVYISGASYEDLKSYFDALSEGADPDSLDELRDMPFGSYGALTDKFGVRWMFQGDAKLQ
jgi:PhnB protein